MSDESIFNPVESAIFQELAFDVLRLDQIDSAASGNKYFKLKYYLESSLANGRKPLVSKGGMFSNHLHALAKACQSLSIPCTCVIRSYNEDDLNPTIIDLRNFGANCHFISPGLFNSFDEVSAAELISDCLYVPEGGSGSLGVKGTKEILNSVDQGKYQSIFVPVGSFGTAAGIIASACEHITVHLIPAWKGCSLDWVEDQLEKFEIKPVCKIRLHNQYHHQGFGRYTRELILFMESFTQFTCIPLEPIYTGKLLFALFDIWKTEPESIQKVLLLHTGGHQGLRGYYYRFPQDWKEYMNLIN